MKPIYTFLLATCTLCCGAFAHADVVQDGSDTVDLNNYTSWDALISNVLNIDGASSFDETLGTFTVVVGEAEYITGKKSIRELLEKEAKKYGNNDNLVHFSLLPESFFTPNVLDMYNTSEQLQPDAKGDLPYLAIGYLDVYQADGATDPNDIESYDVEFVPLSSKPLTLGEDLLEQTLNDIQKLLNKSLGGSNN